MKMTENYEELVAMTKVYPNSAKYTYASLGLASEAGEVAGKIKKYIRGDYESIDSIRDKIIDELGDVMWYVAALAIELESSLEDIQKRNSQKLLNRLAENKIKGDGDNR